MLPPSTCEASADFVVFLKGRGLSQELILNYFTVKSCHYKKGSILINEDIHTFALSAFTLNTISSSTLTASSWPNFFSKSLADIAGVELFKRAVLVDVGAAVVLDSLHALAPRDLQEVH